MSRGPRMTDYERMLIKKLVEKGETDTAIAKLLRRDRSSITRFRNGYLGLPPAGVNSHLQFMQRVNAGQIGPEVDRVAEEQAEKVRRTMHNLRFEKDAQGMESVIGELFKGEEK